MKTKYVIEHQYVNDREIGSDFDTRQSETCPAKDPGFFRNMPKSCVNEIHWDLLCEQSGPREEFWWCRD